MRDLKEFQGDGGTERVLQALGLIRGQAQDDVEARAAAFRDTAIVSR